MHESSFLNSKQTYANDIQFIWYNGNIKQSPKANTQKWITFS